MATTMSINEAVVAEVRDLLDKRGMKITGLAKVTGVPRGTLVNYLTRLRSPMPFDVIGKVAEAFGMTTDELAKRAEARRAQSQDPDGPN